MNIPVRGKGGSVKRVSLSAEANEVERPQAHRKPRKTRDYIAHRDYGTRGCEQDKEIIRFGRTKVTLYRRGDLESGSWFFRMHLKEEGRHFRKSLRTTDKSEALSRLHDEVISLLAKVQSGQRILAVSIKDLLRRYRKHLDEEVQAGQIAANTRKLNYYRVVTGTKFMSEVLPAGLDTKVSALDGEIFKGYLAWRVAQRAAKHVGATIRRDVMRDELLAIRKMFLYARKEKLCTEKTIPVWDFVVEREAPIRRRMTREDYSSVNRCLRTWASEGRDERDSYHRSIVRAIFLVISNSGMRSGEVFGLKNNDLEIHRTANECIITIRPETTKVRRGRKIVLGASLGGRLEDTKPINYLIRWIDEWQRHKEPTDHVFAPYETGAKSVRGTYYHHYQALRTELEKISLEWFDTYHCRHFWITNRLLAEEPIHLVAKAAGTSTGEIEKTYSHVLTEMSTRRFGRKQVVYTEDGSWNIVLTNANL